MNQTEQIFEIGDYEKNPLSGKQSIRDRYLVIKNTEGESVAIRIPYVEKTDNDIPDTIESTVFRTCSMCVFFNSDKYSTSSFCSIRKIMNPSNPGFYFKNPQEKSCEQFTQMQEKKES